MGVVSQARGLAQTVKDQEKVSRNQVILGLGLTGLAVLAALHQRGVVG